jgi:hypothetical protein
MKTTTITHTTTITTITTIGKHQRQQPEEGLMVGSGFECEGGLDYGGVSR